MGWEHGANKGGFSGRLHLERPAMVDPEDVDATVGSALEAVVADAAADELGSNGQLGPSTCANCGSTLDGRYCSSCGQLADLFHRPIWSLIADGLDGLFSLEGRFFKTVPPLMLRPGEVSRNYLAGARARYMAPFRLFLFASLTMFVVLFAVTGDPRDFTTPAPLSSETRQSSDAQVDGPLDASPGEHERPFNERFKCALRAALLSEAPASASCIALQASGAEEVEVQAGDAVVDLPQNVRATIVSRLEAAIDRPDAWVTTMQEWAPRVAFFLFPIYALLLALTHVWRRQFFVYDHVVASLHFHAFLFILVLVLLGLSPLVPTPILVAAGFAWSNYALYKTLRLVYEDSRLGSIARVVLLDVVYLFVLTFAMLALVALGVAFV
jgi:hypothetical protein